MLGLSRDIGIDLGTANTLVCVKGKGIVVREPSVVAVDRDTQRILAFGEEARRMLGRTPGNIIALRPLREGVIADYNATEALIHHLLVQVGCRRHFLRPRVMVCVPSSVTTVEKRAVLQATMEAGARRTYLIEEPMAAALGAGLDISQASGIGVVDIGGGTTDIAVLSLGGVVISTSLRVGGDHFDEAIARFAKREYNLLIGERTAEEIKMQVATADASDRGTCEVRGRDVVTGLPKVLRFTSAMAAEALAEPLAAVIDGVRQVLERTPPELAADILDKGLLLTGGGALLTGMDRALSAALLVPVVVAEDPLSCVALGTLRALDELDHLDSELVSK